MAELAPEEVRWFYKVEPEKGWVRFNGYDSLRIEIRYRHIWQTRWRSHSSAHTRRAHSLNREAGTFSLQLAWPLMVFIWDISLVSNRENSS